MRVPIPHSLGREEARRRLRANSHKMAEGFPAGMAQVETSWPSDDRMAMSIQAMGQAVVGRIDIEDAQVILTVDLPPALGFIEPIVAGAIRQSGQKMLAPPSGD
ncbi:MAG TPA: polyhydroxyalkanoic acid system family protein [Croceibacterium sp.]|nr:polyhydroxyalkanoic acid system family protein [Croceibacterium sp.]